MSSIKITDAVGATADLQIRDDSPLAKAKLTSLLTTAKGLVADFTRPVDQSDIHSASFGAQCMLPSVLLGDSLGLTVSGGICCGMSVVTAANRTLFAPDNFSPEIPIAPSECWVSFAVEMNVGVKVSAAAGAFGATLKTGTLLGLTTYTLFSSSPLPLLKDALASAIEGFSLATNAAALRQQRAGTLYESDLSGAVSLTGTYSVPLSLNALASVDLPMNLNVQVAPTATASVSGTLAVAGELLVRAHKRSADLLSLGVYKKKGTTLTATLTVSAGIGANIGSTDLLGVVLNAALPGVDVAKCGIPEPVAAKLNSVIADALDRSLAISLNASCSAAVTHEPAVLYEIHLDQGDPAATDKALDAALHGDWTQLGALANAHCLRNILVDTRTTQRRLSLNLFGLYSAASLTEYVRKCTILTDESGQVSIIDQQQAGRIQAASTPYASDPEKLRTALAQDLIATASYTLLGSKLNLNLTLVQDYLRYAAHMSRQDLHSEVLLGNVLGLIPAGEFDAILASTAAFDHVCVNATINYNTAQVMSLFFADVASRTPHQQAELEQVGRRTMIALLDPSDRTSQARIGILKDDRAWAAMDTSGNVQQFGAIPQLAALDATTRAAVGADWISIRWWANTIGQVAPLLSQTMTALEKAPAGDPTQDKAFMDQRAKLAAALGAVARDTRAAFVGGWGPAVLFALSGHRAVETMDIAWNSNARHYGPITAQ